MIPKTGDVIQVSSAELYKPAVNEVVDFSGRTYGVLPSHQQAIKNALIATLDQIGISLETVVFSGYNRSLAHEVSPDDSMGGLNILSWDIATLQSEGVFDDDPDLKAQYLDQLAELKARGPLKSYFFGDVSTLDRSPESYINPIHYAGMSEDAVIGVYDESLLLGLDCVNNADFLEVITSPGAIEPAKIMEFYPRFEDLV